MNYPSISILIDSIFNHSIRSFFVINFYENIVYEYQCDYEYHQIKSSVKLSSINALFFLLCIIKLRSSKCVPILFAKSLAG